jgi:hypothetical protein
MRSTHLYWRKYVDSLIIPFFLKSLHDIIRILHRRFKGRSNTPAKRIARSRTKTCWVTHLDGVRRMWRVVLSELSMSFSLLGQFQNPKVRLPNFEEGKNLVFMHVTTTLVLSGKLLHAIFGSLSEIFTIFSTSTSTSTTFTPTTIRPDFESQPWRPDPIPRL